MCGGGGSVGGKGCGCVGCGECGDVGGVVVRDRLVEGVETCSRKVWVCFQTARSMTSTQLLQSSAAQHPQL